MDVWQDLCPNCGAVPVVAGTVPDDAAEAPAEPRGRSLRTLNLVLAMLLVVCVIGVGMQYAKASRLKSTEVAGATTDAAAQPATTATSDIPVYVPPPGTSVAKKGFWTKLKSELEPKPTKRPRATKPG